MKQALLIFLVLLLAALGIYWLNTHQPEVKKHTKKPTLPTVQVATVKVQDYTVVVSSSGLVEAPTQTNLVAEVAGKITLVGRSFQEGSYLKKNALLIKINATDYQHNIQIAKAEIAQKQLALKEQIAQGNLAKQDWDLFGEKRKKPSELAMRTPHIASATAALQAAKVRMDQADLQLSRTRIVAPYDGRVLSRLVDVGQYVTPGTLLGKVFATDYIEVRLPLSLHDYQLLNIPEHYQHQATPSTDTLPSVTFYSDSQATQQWQGRIVRSSAAVDSSTRQISVIARIDNPFAKASTAPQLKLGQFLQANIKGKQLSKVIVIPNTAIHENKVMLFEEESDESKGARKNVQADTDKKTQEPKPSILGRLQLHPVTILHSDDSHVIVTASSLLNNSQIILIPPAIITDNMKVKALQPLED